MRMNYVTKMDLAEMIVDQAKKIQQSDNENKEITYFICFPSSEDKPYYDFTLRKLQKNTFIAKYKSITLKINRNNPVQVFNIINNIFRTHAEAVTNNYLENGDFIEITLQHKDKHVAMDDHCIYADDAPLSMFSASDHANRGQVDEYISIKKFLMYYVRYAFDILDNME